MLRCTVIVQITPIRNNELIPGDSTSIGLPWPISPVSTKNTDLIQISSTFRPPIYGSLAALAHHDLSSPVTNPTNFHPKPIVVLGEPIAQVPQQWLTQRVNLVVPKSSTRADLLAQLTDAQALIVRTYTIVDQELLDAAPNLKVIARAGVGLDNIDLPACKARQIAVVHTPIANTQAVVEYVTQMMLGAIRSIHTLDKPVSSSAWRTARQDAISPTTCVDQQLGIVGFGKIGSSLARVASALGMRVVYTDLREIFEHNRLGCTPMSIEELARTSDVISIHVDGRPANHQLLASSFFNQLKDAAIFLNTSRGFVIDHAATIAFARTNPNAQLIIDVHDPEPIAIDSEICTLDNITITPHIASATSDAKEQMSWVVRDLVRVLEGKDPMFAAQ